MAKHTKTTSPQVPSHDVFHVTGDGEKARWTKLGAAWQHRDGDGFNITLNFVPITQDGRFVVRKVKAQQQEAQA